MNMEQRITHDVILYLTAKDQSSSKIYRKIVETFGENVIIEQNCSQNVSTIFR